MVTQPKPPRPNQWLVILLLAVINLAVALFQHLSWLRTVQFVLGGIALLYAAWLFSQKWRREHRER